MQVDGTGFQHTERKTFSVLQAYDTTNFCGKKLYFS